MASDIPDNASETLQIRQTETSLNMETSTVSPFARTRTESAQSLSAPEAVDSAPLPIPEGEPQIERDIFEKRGSPDSDSDYEGQEGEEVSSLTRSIQEQPEELPIELISLTDRFVNSLGAKVHSSPPTIERISGLFQDFYALTEVHITTHISALASRINREPSSQLSTRSRGGTQQNPNRNDSDKAVPERQMLTASEVTEKRKARKFLAHKHVALEEAVERRACQSIYDRIFQHKSTLDKVRDEKLRSKTAALLLVDINLKDLGVDIDLEAINEKNQRGADECMTVARECLMKMNDEKYPLGKLQHLAAAHKAVVDALTKLLPSSSSADEILPTLIHALVHCPPEGINIISNLMFIQRFRSSSKVDGETAYCLTNLEAAVSFLENVDLSSLRADETQDKLSNAPSETSTPSTETAVKEGPKPAVSSVSATPELLKPNDASAAATLARPRSASSLQQQRLSNLLQPPSKVLGAANNAVRNTADQSLKNIGATLDSSFNFFFGRLKELQSTQLPVTQRGIPVLPKTLAEARRLVAVQGPDGQTLGQELPDGGTPIDESSGIHSTSSAETTLLGQGANTTSRDRSRDSSRQSTGSSNSTPMNPSTPKPLDSMRMLGTSLNPLNHVAGMMKGFGRPGPGRASPASSERPRPSPSSTTSTPPTPNSAMKMDPPIQRFLETQNANELTIGDVSTLLNDYKRLAAAVFKQGDST